MPGNINEASIRQNKFKYIYHNWRRDELRAALQSCNMPGASFRVPGGSRCCGGGDGGGQGGGPALLWICYYKDLSWTKHLIITSGAADLRLRLQVVNGDRAATQNRRLSPSSSPPPANYTWRRWFSGCLLPVGLGFFSKDCKWKGEDVLIEFRTAKLLDLDGKKKEKKEGTRNELT